MADWLLFLYALPTGRSSLRVSLWRSLKKLGALPLKTSAYLLPDSTEHYERFQWLAAQLHDGGGDATLIRTAAIEGLSDRQVRALFNEARAADYAEVNRELTVLVRTRGRKISEESAAAAEKLRARFAEIEEIDFFASPARHDLQVLWQRWERLQGPKPPVATRARRADYRGRTWLTRPRPGIDRVASAWLIRKFIDPQAKFVFTSSVEAHPGAVPYDLLDVDFSHHGEDCTFETLLRRFNLKDTRLKRLAEMVHAADLKDGKFTASEAEGIQAMLRGLARMGWTDEKILQHGLTSFEALYASLA